MPSIIAKNVSLNFPILGSDKKLANQIPGASNYKKNRVGGNINIMENGKRFVTAIDDVSFNFNDGDRVGLYGHNGAGKSTLLRILSGVYNPTSGELNVQGKITSMFNLNLGINREASGLENIYFKGLIYGFKKEKIDLVLQDIIEFSELDDYIYLPVKTYSSGMVMRLMFAIATSFEPDIMLLDEWITAGDLAFRKKVDDRMNQMVETTKIVVVASHEKDRLRDWANRFITMKSGCIINIEKL